MSILSSLTVVSWISVLFYIMYSVFTYCLFLNHVHPSRFLYFFLISRACLFNTTFAILIFFFPLVCVWQPLSTYSLLNFFIQNFLLPSRSLDMFSSFSFYFFGIHMSTIIFIFPHAWYPAPLYSVCVHPFCLYFLFWFTSLCDGLLLAWPTL